VAVRAMHRFELAVTGEEAPLLQLRNGGQGDLQAEKHLLKAISLCRERYKRLADDARLGPEGLQAKFTCSTLRRVGCSLRYCSRVLRALVGAAVCCNRGAERALQLL
jgi:hypothetical protein